MIKVHLVFGLIILLGVYSQKEGNEGRPYEFSFTIDGEQHRYEKKDVNGIIQGEFGFITGDGVYHVTVYATDENGSFKILSMKNTKISEPLDRGGKPSTAGLVQLQTSGNNPGKEIPVKSVPFTTVKPLVSAAIAISTSPAVGPRQPTATTSHTPYDFTTASTIRNGCSGCGIVTKAPAGPLNFQNPAFKKPITKESSDQGPRPELSHSSPEKLTPSRIVSDKESLGEFISKSPLLPVESVTHPNKFTGSSVNLPINRINNVEPISHSNQFVSPSPVFDNKNLRESVPKPISTVTEVSTYSDTPIIGSLNGVVNIEAGNIPSSLPAGNFITPGTNFIPNNNGNRILPNPSYAINPRYSTNNFSKLPKEIPSALSKVTVSDGIIHVPGNNDIQIKDKYPNMVNGLPEGIAERDISDLLYKFNYTVGFHGHYEKGLKNGAKIGGYFVNGRDGISRVVTYVADENGYRPKFKLINLGLDSEDTPKPDSEKKFGLKNFEFIWYPII